MTSIRLRFLLPLWLLACLLVTACQTNPTRPDQTPATDQPLLILVSIDGYRANYFQLGITPTLSALASEGVRAEAVRPAFPTLTFPNHYTLVTGLVPDHHGVTNNSMLDVDIANQRFSLGNREAVENPAWWNDGQPLWNTAREAGLRSATMFWPGSEAPIRGHHPHHWRIFDMSLAPEARVAQVLEWLDLPIDERPNFITLYFDAVDHAGHRFGPDSDEVHAALEHTDAALQQLMGGLQQRSLWDNTNLVVTSDHGMAATPADQVVALDDHIPRKLFRLVTVGPLAGIEPRKGMQARLDAALEKPIPHAQCWRKDRLPERFRYGTHPRIPRWLCMGDEGWTIYDRALLKKITPHPGAHGFDPELESMAALFVARGPDFRTGLTVPGFDNVDVYPLLARLLRIQPEPNDADASATLPLLRPERDFSVRQH